MCGLNADNDNVPVFRGNANTFPRASELNLYLRDDGGDGVV